MFQIKAPFIVLAALLVLTACTRVFAGGMECDVLQYKLGRIYFSAGEEANVYPGCSFIVMCGDDTVYKGQIEESYVGVSLSRATFGLRDTLGLDSCTAIVETALIDSTNAIEFGAYGLLPAELAKIPGDDSGYVTIVTGVSLGQSGKGNPVSISQGEAFSLTWDYESGRYDGFFSATLPPEPIRDHATTISSADPFFAVLIPNLSHKANEQGFVTTSLYYRFDISRLWPAFFHSELPMPANRLYVATGVSPRSYSYDADKGRMLLAKFRDRPDKIKLGVLSPRLENVANFFADILSRDRTRVDVRHGDYKADLMLAFVPLDWDDPTQSLQHIYRLLQANPPKSTAVKETLEILGNQIASAREADDISTQFHFCRLADNTLQRELGVFPLFRPTIFFTSGKNIKNVSFDLSGHLNLPDLTKITLPSSDGQEQ